MSGTRGIVALMTTAVAALAVAAPAQAVITSSLAGSTATVTGTTDNDFVLLGASGGLLTHSESPASAGFTSTFDWDSTAAGDQTLSNLAGSTVILNLGDGVDRLDFANFSLAADVVFNGQGSADFLFAPAGTAGADTATINGNSLAGLGGTGTTSWDAATEQVDISSGEGADVFNVTGTPTNSQVFVNGQGGDDRIAFADGKGLSSSGGFRGGPGTDTLDYSAYTTPVTVDLGRTARFTTRLLGANEVPAVATGEAADGELVFTDLATNTFDYGLFIDGSLTAADITDSHIHSGAAGTNGPVVFAFGPGSTWSDTTGSPSDEATGQTDPDITEPLLRAGNTYMNVHTAAHSGGEIRGQLTLDPQKGYGGTATGMLTEHTVENVIGGSGADTLKGSVPANAFTCGGGSDTVTVETTDTLTDCEMLGSTTTVTGVDPASPADNLTPRVKGMALTGSTVQLFANATCAGTPTATGSAADFAGAGIQATVPDGSLTTFSALATHAGAKTACSATSVSYQETAAATPGPGTGAGTSPPTQTTPVTPPPVMALGTLTAFRAKATATKTTLTIDTGATATCPAAAKSSCTVTATARTKIKRRSVTLGKLTATLAPGKSLKVKLPVSRVNAKLWRKAGRLAVTIDGTVAVPGGTAAARRTVIRLKAPPAKKR